MASIFVQMTSLPNSLKGYFKISKQRRHSYIYKLQNFRIFTEYITDMNDTLQSNANQMKKNKLDIGDIECRLYFRTFQIYFEVN